MKTRVMGILNVTPDSFSDGGRFDTVERAVARGRRMVEEGAHILDVGGESTRPGARAVATNEELRRTVPVVRALRAAFADSREEPLISIDTRKPEVARAAVEAGADMWNDVSGLTFSPQSLEMAVDLGCELVLMHAQGTPETMQDDPRYDDPVTDVRSWLAARVALCRAAGTGRIWVDPGIGFGKRLEDNLVLLANLDAFVGLGDGILVGASRKSFIARLDGSQVEARLGGSLAAALLCARKGAGILRVHDVHETVQALVVAEAVSKSESRNRRGRARGTLT